MIEIKIGASRTSITMGDLQPGDIFMRDAKKERPLAVRAVYVVNFQHGRLDAFREPNAQTVVTNIRTGRVAALRNDQCVLKLEGTLIARIANNES